MASDEEDISCKKTKTQANIHSQPQQNFLWFFAFHKGGLSRSFLQRQKVITSKSLSKNLSNVNKLGIFIHFLSRKQQKMRFIF